MAPGLEVRRVHGKRQGDSRDRPDAWNRCKVLAERVGLVLLEQLPIHHFNLCLEIGDVLTYRKSAVTPTLLA